MTESPDLAAGTAELAAVNLTDRAVLVPVPQGVATPPVEPAPTLNLYHLIGAIYAFFGVQSDELTDSTVRLLRALIAGIALTILDYAYGWATGTGPHGFVPLGSALAIGVTTALGKFVRDRYSHDLLF